MSASNKTHEIRCPIYGFIQLSAWEREIIDQPAFQRLHRIRQLALTDYIYPGAMHTRLEHSLGVMHMATMLYEGVVDRSRDFLVNELGYNEDGLRRHKTLVRIAALLHDLGHAPFSHAAEELFPKKSEGVDAERYEHEDYSGAIVRRCFDDVINNHQLNRNYDFTADDVANLIEGNPEAGHALFWRDLIAGQMDADRMDYLLRDSLHAGVNYGRYDWRRLVNTIQGVPGTESSGPRIGVHEGGWHAAEGLILARYFMFTQVYFHKTRVAYDYHLKEALQEILPGGCFPRPVGAELDEYLKWDDWRLLGQLSQGNCGEGGKRLSERNHYREVAHTPETPIQKDLDQLDHWRETLGDMLAAEIPAEKSWYKVGITDVPVFPGTGNEIKPLSYYSSVVAVKPIRQVRLYVRPEDQEVAEKMLIQ